MKKHILFNTIFSLLLGWSNLLQAQCDTAIISTYPTESNTGNQTGNLPPQNKNPERPNMRNTFNWMVDDPNTWMTEGSLIDITYSLLNARIPNPLDSYPIDEWELLSRNRNVKTKTRLI